MDTRDDGFEVTCHVSKVESGGYRLTVKRGDSTFYEMLDDDIEEIKRVRDRYLDPNDFLSRIVRWGGFMDDEEVDEMLDAIYAARGRDWRPT